MGPCSSTASASLPNEPKTFLFSRSVDLALFALCCASQTKVTRAVEGPCAQGARRVRHMVQTTLEGKWKPQPPGLEEEVGIPGPALRPNAAIPRSKGALRAPRLCVQMQAAIFGRTKISSQPCTNIASTTQLPARRAHPLLQHRAWPSMICKAQKHTHPVAGQERSILLVPLPAISLSLQLLLPPGGGCDKGKRQARQWAAYFRTLTWHLLFCAISSPSCSHYSIRIFRARIPPKDLCADQDWLRHAWAPHADYTRIFVGVWAALAANR